MTIVHSKITGYTSSIITSGLLTDAYYNNGNLTKLLKFEALIYS